MALRAHARAALCYADRPTWSSVRALLMSEPIGCVSSSVFLSSASSTSSGRFSSCVGPAVSPCQRRGGGCGWGEGRATDQHRGRDGLDVARRVREREHVQLVVQDEAALAVRQGQQEALVEPRDDVLVRLGAVAVVDVLETECAWQW